MKNYIFFAALMHSFLFNAQTIQVDASLNGTTTNTCAGFIIDSGGQGGTGYGNNENVTFTVCPNTPDDIISVQFNLFSLDVFDDNPLPGPNQVNLDQMFVYDGNSTAANPLGNYTGTGLQGVLIQCSPLNTSGCLTFRFISNSNNAANGFFTASANCVTPCDDPVAGGVVLSGITQDSIHACIGEQINFENLNSFAQPGFTIASYTWDFMDGSTTNGQNVSHSYVIPGHYRVQLFVTDNNNCVNNNLIDIDVLVATPPNFASFQPDTTLCIGESLQLIANPLFYENTWSGFSGSTTIDDGCLPDTLLGIAQNIDVIQTGFLAGTTIQNASQIQSLCLELEHSFMGDIVVIATCPNGQNVILHQQGGGGTYLGEPNENVSIDCSDPSTIGVPYQYCFDASATQTWVEYADANGGTLPPGTYEPIQPLSGLVGCPANGVWTLTVVDNWAADDGAVFSFGVNLDPALYADVVEFTPQHDAGQDSSYWTFPAQFASNLDPAADQMLVTPTSVGVYPYTYNVVNSFGCQNDTTIFITVTDFTLPFLIEDTATCAGAINLVDNSFVSCAYTINLYDSFGDSWNGNNLHVTVNGTTSVYTISNAQSDFNTININVTEGANMSFFFDGSGSFLSECSFEIIDPSGNIVYSDGGDFSSPTTAVQNLLLSCIGAYDVSWTPANVFDNPNSINPLGTFNQTTNVTVSFSVIGHPQCVHSDNATVSIAQLPAPTVDTSYTICSVLPFPIDLFVALDPVTPTNGFWLDAQGNPMQMPFTDSILPEGNYLYDFPVNNCYGHELRSITILHELPIRPNITVLDPDLCLGDSAKYMDISLDPNIFSNAVYFNNQDSLIFQGTSDFSYLYPAVGLYGLYMKTRSDLGCLYRNTYDTLIQVHAGPSPDFISNANQASSFDPVVDFTDLSSLDVVSYFWKIPSSDVDTTSLENPTVTFPLGVAGYYSVSLVVTNSTGCKDSITKIIQIEDVPTLYIPNSFTPNGDELNNTWKIEVNGIDIALFRVSIYNRWGEIIFVSNDPTIGWDGTFGDELVTAGIYQYRLEAVDEKTKIPFEKFGFINIFR